jgi:hypothetical protein
VWLGWLNESFFYPPCALIIVVAAVTSVPRAARFDGTISVLPVLANRLLPDKR